jgi:Translation initiation factor eIF3 subunit
MTNMKAADAKEISSSVNAIANEKLKLEKDAQAGKKKTGNLSYMGNCTLKSTACVLSKLLLHCKNELYFCNTLCSEWKKTSIYLFIFITLTRAFLRFYRIVIFNLSDLVAALHL